MTRLILNRFVGLDTEVKKAFRRLLDSVSTLKHRMEGPQSTVIQAPRGRNKTKKLICICMSLWLYFRVSSLRLLVQVCSLIPLGGLLEVVRMGGGLSSHFESASASDAFCHVARRSS